MPTTNLDKFYAIQKIMEEFETLKEPYLKALQDRYEFMSEYRREYRKLVRALNDIKSSLNKDDATTEEVDILKKSARISLRKQIEGFEEAIEADPYNDYDKAIDAANEAIDNLNKRDIKNLEEIRSDLNNHNIKVKEIDALTEYAGHSGSQSEQKAKVLELINIAEADYLSSFKDYREACENEEGVTEMFDDIFSVLAQLGYDLEASIMADALPDLEESRKNRPDPEPLLEVLKPVKSANLEYWQTKRRKAVAYQYNMAYAKEVAYTRRALLEDREYIGTRNAFDRLYNAYEELSGYMYDRYHELGGTPYNYHGHMDRIK
ncbi:hypothetical protein [Aquaspirillum serpens]|uniref:hypothetical protein n=1 Tax=Aquaspirillum serpens TaxID=190 RepID=UPI0003B57145|nr:hypothetical protein [Aquaspirillum serpens]